MRINGVLLYSCLYEVCRLGINGFMGAANLYWKNIWKLHSLFNAYVSDQGPQFVVDFTQELYCLLHVKLHTSTAYHLQSNRQTTHCCFSLWI